MPEGTIRCSCLLPHLSPISPTTQRRFLRASARNPTRTNRSCAAFPRARRGVERASAARRFPDMNKPDVIVAKKIRAGDRAALARAITLVESKKPAHRAEAQELLRVLLPFTGRAIRC